MNPHLRRRLALWHLVASILGGIYCTVAIAKDPYERVLIAISFYAITITAWDVWQTSDVRVEQETDQ